MKPPQSPYMADFSMVTESMISQISIKHTIVFAPLSRNIFVLSPHVFICLLLKSWLSQWKQHS